MQLSVVIPTLNEAERLPRVVGSLRRQDPYCEIVVVDGGSHDGTAALARRLGLHCLATAPGRGRQLAAGAAASSGDTLLFLHADTRLGDGALAAMRRALADPAVSGGNFRVLFDGGDAFSAWLDGFYAWFRRYGLYYGDSAIFVRRAVYDRIGGIRPIALMEDYDLNRRLERHGGTVCIADPPVVTSARRFAGRRPAAIFAEWILLHLLYHLGTPPGWLAWLYDSARRRRARRRSRHSARAASLSDQS